MSKPRLLIAAAVATALLSIGGSCAGDPCACYDNGGCGSAAGGASCAVPSCKEYVACFEATGA